MSLRILDPHVSTDNVIWLQLQRMNSEHGQGELVGATIIDDEPGPAHGVCYVKKSYGESWPKWFIVSGVLCFRGRRVTLYKEKEKPSCPTKTKRS